MTPHEWQSLPTGGFVAVVRGGSIPVCSVRTYRRRTGRVEYRACYRGVRYYSASWTELLNRMDTVIRRFHGMEGA